MGDRSIRVLQRDEARRFCDTQKQSESGSVGEGEWWGVFEWFDAILLGSGFRSGANVNVKGACGAGCPEAREREI